MSAIAKALTAGAGAATSIVALGVLPHNVDKYVAAGVSVATAAAVYLVPNTPKAGKETA